MELNVGDMVVCTNVYGDITAPGVGSRNIITEINLNHSWPISAIDIDQDNLEIAYDFSEVEPIDYWIDLNRLDTDYDATIC